MAENSKIEWTDHTHNFWVGCTEVSAACDHCYARTMSERYGWAQWGSHPRHRTSEANWRKPLTWNAKAKKLGVRLKVFTNSLADFFDNQVDSDWREAAWRTILECDGLDWLILTKRPQNIAKMLPSGVDQPKWPWPNVWLGTTVENQEEADRRIPHLLAVPAAVRFLSCEPLLGPVNLRPIHCRDHKYNIDQAAAIYALEGVYQVPGSHWSEPHSKINWVIAGSESGPKARACDLDWVRSLRDQCSVVQVPFFWKQHIVNGRKFPLPDLDGKKWAEFPL